MNKDIKTLRELGSQLRDIAADPVMDTRRRKWTELNSLKKHHIPIFVLDPQFTWKELFDPKALVCEDPLYREYENFLRLTLYRATFGDDSVIEPYLIATQVFQPEAVVGCWGMPDEYQRIESTLAHVRKEVFIQSTADLAKLIPPRYLVDERATQEKLEKLNEAFNGILPVELDTKPDGMLRICQLMDDLLGAQEMLYLLYDDPDCVKAFAATLRDAILTVYRDVNQSKGFFTGQDAFLTNATIQSMPYCEELPSPQEKRYVDSKQMWLFSESQPFEGVSPEMFNEFLLTYEKPIFEMFGLVAYGCCETLDRKIPYLKTIPNLRRIAVAPLANVRSCAEQIGSDYVISWRPNPTEMVSCGFDEERIRRIIDNALRIMCENHCYCEVNLKDFITVEGDASRIQRWATIVREVAERYER